MNIQSFSTLSTLRQSTWLAALVLCALVAGFVIVEPAISHSVSDQITVTQSVTAEISFVTPTADVTMDTAIPGITGGTANGATQVRVYTNNAEGYTMTLMASGSPAMQGNSQGGSIADFSTTTVYMAEPAYNFSVPANSAGFGYSVEATSTTDLDQSFLDNGSVCNSGGGSDTAFQCWIGASTTAYTIINRSTDTPASGATTTLKFRTVIQSNPAPAIPEDTYVATTTLTATVNP